LPYVTFALNRPLRAVLGEGEERPRLEAPAGELGITEGVAVPLDAPAPFTRDVAVDHYLRLIENA
jgi:hypothetical protein